MSDFVPGLELSGRFYREAVRPLLDEGHPGLRHSAALIGPGSEVLGYDGPTSTDHSWGPRVLLFLAEADRERAAGPIRRHLAERLPTRFLGYPTHFTEPGDDGSIAMCAVDRGPVRHRVQVTTLERFFRRSPGLDPGAPIAPADWLTFPQQVLRSLTAGAVFHDDLGLAALRETLRWYPRDVWLYLLAASWTRIAQEEAFVGRTLGVGDELGSRLIATRLARDLMRLCFLMERTYAPYAKWLGTAFAELECASALTPILERIVAADTGREREAALTEGYREAARMHNELGLTPAEPTEVSPFHARPFLVIHGERFARALVAAIEDPAVRRIAARRLIGGIDHISDSTDLAAPEWRGTLRRLYDPD